jgi:hypothetical protein
MGDFFLSVEMNMKKKISPIRLTGSGMGSYPPSPFPRGDPI